MENYQLLMEKQIEKIKQTGNKPRLLLHACCAPCSSYCLELLAEFFEITVFFYNPNISPEEEYLKRYDELSRFIEEGKIKAYSVKAQYDYNEFLSVSKGLENEPEGGKRCYKCYRLRLFKTAEYAKNNGFDYFATTLSISPYKNAEWLNKLGSEAEERFGVHYLYADFKKKNGYKRSIELSKIYDLYRQDYCGCAFSKAEKKRQENLPQK